MSSTLQTNSPSFPLGRAALVLGAVTLTALAMGAGIFLALGQQEQFTIGAVTALALFSTSLISLIPIARLGRSGPDGLLQGFLLSLAIRMPLCLGMAALIAFTTPLDAFSVCAWSVGWYMLLLLTEVTLVVRHMKKILPAASLAEAV